MNKYLILYDKHQNCIVLPPDDQNENQSQSERTGRTNKTKKRN